MENVYFTSSTGFIGSGSTIYSLKRVVGEDFYNENILPTLKFYTTPPDVIDLLRHSSEYIAMKRYMEIHNVNIRTAKDMVGKIKNDMERFAPSK